MTRLPLPMIVLTSAEDCKEFRTSLYGIKGYYRPNHNLAVTCVNLGSAIIDVLETVEQIDGCFELVYPSHKRSITAVLNVGPVSNKTT